MNKAVIIVAGGKGLRMGGDIPKQFLEIDGKPILMHTIQRFYDYDPEMLIVVVLPESQHLFWKRLCDQYHFSIPYTIATGGEERFHSVLNGLNQIPSSYELIAVHDGVRPFVSTEVISRCFDGAKTHGAVIPVIDVVETVRHIIPGGSETVPRSEYKLVQTPQVFSAPLLRKAYEQPYTTAFTDDASVIESLGHPVVLVEGNRENIKITTKADLK